MINWFDMPDEGLSNGGQFEVKELEVTENGTYETKGEMYNKVTVNVEGGGGSWQTVFDGSVTTTAEDNVFSGEIEGLGSLTANTIKVTFNGVEYTCERDQDGYYGAPFNFETEQYDWSEFPFVINTSEPGKTWLVTQTAGTYTLKIEEPQSGGSSDFSTAEVTVVKKYGNSFAINVSSAVDNDEAHASVPYTDSSNIGDRTKLKIILYKGNAVMRISDFPLGVAPTITTSGNIQYIEIDDIYIITGDCTITIS